jgi:hypothetical protein
MVKPLSDTKLMDEIEDLADIFQEFEDKYQVNVITNEGLKDLQKKIEPKDPLIKQLRQTVNNQDVKIQIWSDDQLTFDLYESEVSIVYKKNDIYIECEVFDGQITADMMEQMVAFCKVLADNQDELESWI